MNNKEKKKKDSFLLTKKWQKSLNYLQNSKEDSNYSWQWTLFQLYKYFKKILTIYNISSVVNLEGKNSIDFELEEA